MKKWIKGLTIAGIVLLCVGTGITAVAGIAGGTAAIKNFKIGNYNIDNFEIVPKEDMVLAATYTGVKNLDITASYSSIKVVENPELKDEIRIYEKEKTYCGVFHEEDESSDVSINYYSNRKSLQKYGENYAEGIVEIPVGYKFDSVTLEAEAGVIEIPFVLTNHLKLDAEAGVIRVSDFETDYLSLSASAGSIEATGDAKTAIDAEVEAGSVDLSLAGSKEDYDINIESALGDISIGEDHYSGISIERNIGSGAPKKIKLECGLGSMDINFYGV
ncbi:MAG: DUF4097 family beta strand repeat-containing protein [Clostridium sp.]